MTKSIYDYKVRTIDHKEVSLSQYKGKVMLIVNVASQCGLTPQYKDLQALYEKYHDKGFEILGFPANNFGQQEPGSEEEIKAFCTKNYGVTFPMFEKVSVKGKDICELYQFLTKKELNGVMDAEVSWNFEKFIIDKNGKLVANFEPTTKPMSEKITQKIEELLAK
ncbi:MAG: glutathione peroxidase [Bacteroidia bacterium]|nr:glutathione peroxidase [Bacteroidia bacterium]MDW8346445.1 glutathione peroxidase [Bacteroidia bacterium]